MNGLARTSVLIVIVALAGGCGKSEPSIIGTWKYDDAKSGADVGLRFDADGRFEYWFKGSRVNVQSSGTYIYKHGRLTMNTERAVMTSGEVVESPRSETSKIEWSSADELVLSNPEGSMTLRRVL